MKYLLKRFLTGALCLGLCASAVPTQAFAAVTTVTPRLYLCCHESEHHKCSTTITLSDTTCTYDGTAHCCGEACVEGSTCKVTYHYYADAACTEELDCAPTKPGTYYVVACVAADSNYKAAQSNVAVLKICKAKQCITVKSCTRTCKASSCKTSSCHVTVTATAKGKVTCKKISGSSHLSISSAGRITVKKGTKAGTYSMRVKFCAASTTCYKSAYTYKTIKVVVK